MTTFTGPPVESVDGIGALTIGGFLVEVAQRFGPNEALVFDDPLRGGATVRWTYDDLLHESQGIAAGLISSGVRRHESVGILMGNRPEAVASIFGAALAGAIAVPMSTFAPPTELAHMIDAAEVVSVLTQDRLLARRFADDLAVLAPERPSLRHVAAVGTPSWAALLAHADLHPPTAAVTPDDDALVIFSSGTTSLPKGVLHGHRAPTMQFWVQAGLFGRHEATRMWTALPLFWTAGLNTAMGSTLAAGGCWVMQETFEPGEALRLMERERVTEPYTLPHQTGALEEHPAWATADLSSLRCVYGKSAFARHPSVAHPDTGWTMPVGYGLSETCAFFVSHRSSTPRELTKRSMGKLLPGNQLRIIDPDSGRVLGVDADGELAIKGPTLMKRYLGKASSECFDGDGFFHTGDAGHVDADGYVHFAGRRTEMIKTGGANVSPAEIEVQLRACPSVKLSRIVGVPDPRLDQLVVACITLKDGADATEADIRAFLKERVAAYKVPKRVLFFDDGEIPMTTSDTKVRDDALLAIVRERLTTEPIHPERRPMTTTDAPADAPTDTLDASDLDQHMGVPMEPGELKDPVALNDIRRWVQAMHYPNPLHYDEVWAAESRFGTIVAPQSYTVATDTSHGCSPAQVGKIPNSHLIFGGDDWWFFGPRIEPGDHFVCHRMPYDYRVTNTSFAGPTCFQRGDTLYINQKGERVALQRSTAIRYQVREAKEKKAFKEVTDPEWTDAQLAGLDEIKGKFIDQIQTLRHDKRLFDSVTVGDELAPNVLGPHSLASFTTEWRAFPMTTWGATAKGPTTVRAEELGYTKEMAGFEGDRRMERVNPELTDGAYYGPSRGHLQPRWAQHVGMPRGYGYGASMGAWIIDYVAAWAGEWGFVRSSTAQYRNPAFTGDATFLSGKVIDKRVERRRKHLVRVRVELHNQDDTVMAKAEADVELPNE